MTPAQVKVSRMVLEHNSEQLEGGINRQVKCKIFCVCLGESFNEEMLGQQVSVLGFLSMNSQQKLVLHVTKLKILD